MSFIPLLRLFFGLTLAVAYYYLFVGVFDGASVLWGVGIGVSLGFILDDIFARRRVVSDSSEEVTGDE